MTEQKYRCEAAVHDPRCDGWATQVDHFTAKSVARALGWTDEQTNAPENLQHLNHHCHKLKDTSTPARKRLAQKLSSGELVTQKDYIITIENAHGFIRKP